MFHIYKINLFIEIVKKNKNVTILNISSANSNLIHGKKKITKVELTLLKWIIYAKKVLLGLKFW